ncbi:E3 ubiquitin-protein ligase RBBP6 isoform X2 [Lucilia sericata]|uniref:E3 ubiquitin-protein ligase RBBP6 isoform X2 n=1 Tax=Lucilia sericata TaxID=13632 RepID=UPI0018A83036|nr:E3 ubiquitin-protein ligase RBBP6 isoform X2 [Lucilia sericata]
MSVHYKFKSTLDYDTITFDGLHISVADLKKAILQQKRLSKITDFDLQIINAQTKEEYQHESSLIPKNTSLIISRVPVANQTKKSWDPTNRPVQPRIPSKVESADFDLSKMEGSEEDKIQAMMLQSTAEYDPKSYQKIRGYSQTGEVPSTYRCNKCKKGGHWIKNCPYIISKEHTVEKRTTGIPKSFRDKDDRALMIESQEPVVEEDKKQEIPEDLICGICNDLFVDAVMIPCCGSSFCDDCVRTALLESEDNECPDCKEKGSSPGSLIPNRFLRNSVNAFKNRTGYKASSQAKKELNQQSKEELEVKQPENLNDKEQDKELPTTKTEEPEPELEEKVNIEPKGRENKEVDTEALTQPIEEPTADSNIESIEVRHKSTNVNSSPAHEDSDFEDNIVVTVPSASDTRTEKYLSRRHTSHPKPPGIEQSSPKNKHQASPYQQESNSHRSSETSSHSTKEWENSSREKVRDHHENANNEHYMYEKSRAMPPSKSIDNVQPPGANPVPVPLYPSHQPYDMQQQRPIRPMNMHPGFHNHMHRPPLYPHPNMPPHHPPHQMRLPMPPINSYDPTYNQIGNVAPGYQRFPSAMPNRFNYPIREAEAPNQMRPFNNIASVYEEVAAKVGVGIIDDPLEAFNRIMKEKEKKKDERRSPDRRRRSKERHVRGNFRTSPYNNRTKDHGYHDKRGRSRDRDNDRRWPRYGKPMDKERERERDRDRERERDRERDKDQGYRTRRSKSLDRSSRSRSLSPPVKRYRSPQNTKTHSVHEKHQHHYHQKFRLDEQQEEGFERQRRDSNRTLTNPPKSLDPRGGSRQHIDHEDKNMELRPYNINDENSEPPPPGFEVQSSRNPFHSNNTSPPPAAIRERDRPLRNNTPDLYEKCVSQDMEENKLYNIGSKSDQRSGSRSRTRSRSRSRSSLRLSEKRRKVHRSMTPKGKPSDGHTKREKDNTLTTRSHSHSKRKSEERHSKKDKELNDHESKRRSMTPPRQKDTLSDQHQTSSETDHKEKSESKKSDKKLKDRKKKRREKSERKKVKKEKKSKKERHRLKSEDASKDDENDEHNTSTNSAENQNEQENKLEKEFKEHQKEDFEEEGGEYHSIEKVLGNNSTPKTEQNGSVVHQGESTPKNQQPTTEYEEKTPTSSDIKCFDAVLDIHEYETDFDDNSFKLQESANKLVPEASKWELEDQVGAANQYNEANTDGAHTQNNADNKVTNDVIVRAEKAIFARAINAIRPLEVRKKSLSKERSSKCYSDDHESIRNIQITLPVNINKDRSVEVKTENNEKKKSIKDRLGSKISQPIYSQLADTRRDPEHTYKSSYANADRDADSDRRKKISTDSKVSSKKSEIDKNYRERHGKDRDRERSHDKEKARENKDRDKDRERERDKDRDKERNRERDRERERDRDRERGKDKERERHRDKDNIDKDRDLDKDRIRERTRDRHGHETDIDRTRLNSKSRDQKTSKTDKAHHSSEREHREYESTSRKRHHSTSPAVVQRKRSPSSSNSDSDDEDRKRKHSKSDKKSRKRSESPDSDGGKKSSKKKNKSDKKKKKKSKK